MKDALAVLRRYLICLAALFALVAVTRDIIPINATTAALYMLLVVLAAATKWGLAESIFASVAGVLTFNFFFIPPLGAFTVADPQNWVALFAFLVTAITASKLSSNSKQRAEEALTRGNEIAKLYDLSRALLMEDGKDTVRNSVLRAAQILRIGEIAFFDAAVNQIYGTLGESRLSIGDMERVVETGEEFSRNGTVVTPVRMGAHTIGSLAIAEARLSRTVRDSVASLLAINYERSLALDRAAAAEIARRNEEFKSSLLDGLAHDLKTPLTAIRTCVTHLISAPPRTEEVRQELLSIVDQESIRLQISLTETIELARIESHELRLEPEQTGAAELIESALAEVRDEDRTRYSVTLMPPGMTVRADPALFRRALTQVLENARKYTPPNSPVEVRAVSKDDAATIAVLDRGPGVAAEDLSRIFAKFHRGRAMKDRVEGTGMGLAIVKSIVEAHGGSVRAENREGGGLAVIFSLPQK